MKTLHHQVCGEVGGVELAKSEQNNHPVTLSIVMKSLFVNRYAKTRDELQGPQAPEGVMIRDRYYM